ncbi:BREX system P-loop protein BrxC [Clostridium tarantellae]|uniref:BREX system P-loop protein BrxC n=2 Tax=Clostridium tarantellae TaxID=39493 RepID=A0A6I1MJD7_9CLOT|nr:BREX system P-loop protein BrxC [Clostridium tarantellae]
MTEEGARNWYNKAEENYSISIEKFAKKVLQYIKSKGKNHHVVFLVDEIGQYIGDNTQLMLNLQTVVEDLGTYCEGKCWVIVTSQEGLDEFTKVKGNDFSKIQGRFNTRLSLSSANVDEVIKKRLLRKTEQAEDHLKMLYGQKESIIKNLLTFTSDTAEMKLYKDAQDFSEVYPFIPYQFNLLQKTFNGVREHGASGKHLSKGERSLLGAYQQIGVEYMNKESGILVPFSAFYDTIETFLDSSINSVIIHAKKNTRLNDFDVDVLKLLFLIKYVKEIKGNLENLSTLLISNIDEDKVEVKKKVKESLDRLIRETLVQKNGDEYIFLTNDEQDVNKEIKNMPVDGALVIQKIGEIIFEDVYNEKKFRFSREYNFPFNQIVDATPRGAQSNEIGVKVITPSFDLVGASSETELKLLSSREDNVIINISNDSRYLEEIENALKIESYLRVKGGSKSTQAIEDIKSKKGREKEERLKRAKDLIELAIEEAEIYVNSSIIDVKSKKPIERINDGLRALVHSKYAKLNYIKKFTNSTKDLFDILNRNVMQMSIDGDKEDNKLALTELDNHINQMTDRNITLTVKGLLNKFSAAPFGWKELDIQALIIELFKKQEIKIILNDRVIAPEDKSVVDYVTKREYLERTLLKKREKVNPKYIRALKDLYKDVFDMSTLPEDEDRMMKHFKSSCETELTRIERMLVHYNVHTHYPGEKILKDGKSVFQEILNIKDTLEFFKEVSNLEDDLLDYSEQVPNVKSFFDEKGTQKKYFDEGAEKLNNYKNNEIYLTGDEIKEIVKSIRDIIISKEPYKKIPNLPVLVGKYNDKIFELLEEKSKPVKETIEVYKSEVFEELNKHNFKDEYSNRILEDFNNIIKKLETLNSFGEIAAIESAADATRVRWISVILEKARVEREKAEKEKIKEKDPIITETPKVPVGINSTPRDGEIPKKPEAPKPPQITNKYVSVKELVKGTKVIKNEEDINVVLEQLRAKLKQQLDKDTIINLI